MIIVTSFTRSVHLPFARKFSVCKWQPPGFGYEELTMLMPVDNDHTEIRARSLLNPLRKNGVVPVDKFSARLINYRARISDAFSGRSTEILHWLESVRSSGETVALCCWCPYTETAQAQLASYGKFACHTGLIAAMIRELAPDIPVILDDDRHRDLFDEWKPKG